VPLSIFCRREAESSANEQEGAEEDEESGGEVCHGVRRGGGSWGISYRNVVARDSIREDDIFRKPMRGKTVHTEDG
jgi:hypothetical protein